MVARFVQPLLRDWREVSAERKPTTDSAFDSSSLEFVRYINSVIIIIIIIMSSEYGKKLEGSFVLSPCSRLTDFHRQKNDIVKWAKEK